MNKISVLFLIVFISSSLIGFGQKNIDTIQISAVMLVHADFENFVLDKSNSSITEIYRKYHIKTLKSTMIFDFKFFKIELYLNSCKCYCSFFLAYNTSENKFYKLTGFRQSEFSEFFNEMLYGGAVSFPSKVKKNKQKTKYIFDFTDIEDFDINIMYNMYYNKPHNSVYDKTSCYRRRIITYYAEEKRQ